MIDEVMMLRHGRTQYNLEHRLQGQIDVPLDIVGQWQVDQTGFALASRYYWAKVNRSVPNRPHTPSPIFWDCQSPVTNDCVNAASASGKA